MSAQSLLAAPVFDIYAALESAGWDNEEALVSLSRRIFDAAAKELGLLAEQPVEISLLFADDARVRPLNLAWRDQDKPTNVLSFPSVALTPGGALPPVLGDIILACETVKREAMEEAKPFEDHVAHLLLHGFLHLLGYDHHTDAGADVMEALETRILAKLAIPDPYAVIDAAS